MVVPSENKFTGELLSVGHVKINKSKPKPNLHQNTLSKTYELNEFVMVDVPPRLIFFEKRRFYF